MTSQFKTLFVLIVLSLTFQIAKAQYPKWNDPNSLPIWMTPEEETRKHEIGKNFLKSAAITGPVRNIAEFERMEGVLVRYPLGLPTSLIATFSQHTKVYTLVSSTTNENLCKSAYQSAGANMTNCLFIRAATDSYWTRDYGPWFITDQNNKVSIVDFPYNRPRANDDAVPGVVATYFGVTKYNMPVIHTGGNYMTDGWGKSASTDLVISENSSETFVRTNVLSYLGVDTYHITIDPLGDYIKHIDCWGKFLDVDKVLIAQVPTTNANYSKYEQVANYFASQTSAYGTPYQIFRVYEPNGEPYTNSLILNDRVYVPTKGTSSDAAALNVYRTAMPGYTVTGITYSSWSSTDALHCRAIGLADRGMLYINHLPINGTKNYQPSFDITAEIVPYSTQALNPDSLLVFYKTDVNTSYTAIDMVNTSGTSFAASIPVAANVSSVSYYILAKDISGRREMHPFIGKLDPHTFSVIQNIPVTSVSVSPASVALLLNQTQQLTATVLPANATNKSVTWSSSNSSVATVSSSGLVTAVGSGSAVVTVTTVDGGKTATSQVTVTIPVSGVTVSPTSVSLTVGTTQQLTATVSPANATNKSVTWSSGNITVATVNSTGLVTAVGAGTANITVTTTDGNFTATCQVNAGILVTGVAVDPSSAVLSLNQTLQLNANVEPSNATNKLVTWSSNNTSAATVSSGGLVTAVGNGTAVITVTTVDGGFKATCTVTAIVPVTGVTLTPASATLNPGKTLQLTATVNPANATNKNVLWTSSNTTVATVSGTGLVTTIGVGGAVITVTTEDGNKTATSAITIVVGCTYQSIDSEGFATSWGIWTDGGTDCARTTSYSSRESYSIWLRDNTSTSLMTTGNLNLSAYNELTVTFSYVSVGFETGEDFWLQISTNGGTSYTTVLDLNCGTQFSNGQRKIGTAIIQGPFTSTTRLRLRADASADDDVVYIDYVDITGCKDPTKVASIRPEALAVTDLDNNIVVYPNPTSGKLNISSSIHSDEQVRISVISLTGQVIYQEKTTLGSTHTLDIGNLVTGYCLLRIDTREGSVYRKVLVKKTE